MSQTSAHLGGRPEDIRQPGREQLLQLHLGSVYAASSPAAEPGERGAASAVRYAPEGVAGRKSQVVEQQHSAAGVVLLPIATPDAPYLRTLNSLSSSPLDLERRTALHRWGNRAPSDRRSQAQGAVSSTTHLRMLCCAAGTWTAPSRHPSRLLALCNEQHVKPASNTVPRPLGPNRPDSPAGFCAKIVLAMAPSLPCWGGARSSPRR